jgi:hypothetical protein
VSKASSVTPSIYTVLCTLPKNLKEQEQKFKESNYSVNPIFEYENEATTTRFLMSFKMEDDP